MKWNRWRGWVYNPTWHIRGRPWPFVSGSLPFPSLSKNDVSHGGPTPQPRGIMNCGTTLSTKTTEKEREMAGFFYFIFIKTWTWAASCLWGLVYLRLRKHPLHDFFLLFFFLPRKKKYIILLHKFVLRALDIISFFRGVTRSHVNNLLLFNLLISQLNKIYSLIKIHFFYLCISLSQ
jgi:hypothetical protein